jgi:hypothetical protein
MESNINDLEVILIDVALAGDQKGLAYRSVNPSREWTDMNLTQHTYRFGNNFYSISEVGLIDPAEDSQKTARNYRGR